jgi:hypothetical protein
MIEILGVKNANKLVPIEDDATPVDPVQENQNILTQKPIKAFVEQNHDAHMMAHQSFIQNPHIQQMLQQNPLGQAIMASALAHINEHMAFKYRLQVEQLIGQSLPPMTKQNSEKQPPEVPKEMADQIAIKAAQATQQLLQQDQQAAQQQAAQQQMQDPVVQMQMQELQLKQQEVQLKAQKQQQEAQAKVQQLQIEAARIEAQKEIAAMQVSANAAAAKDKLNKQMESEGVRMGIDAAKHRAEMAADHRRNKQDMFKHVTNLSAQARGQQNKQKPKKETE